MNYIRPLIETPKLCTAHLQGTGQGGTETPITPDCSGGEFGNGNCTSLFYACNQGNWEVNLELANTNCTENPTFEGVGCQILVNGFPLDNCSSQSCNDQICTGDYAYYRVFCQDSNPACFEPEANITVSCPDGNSQICGGR